MWNVPTDGIAVPSSANVVGPGTSGSCRCITSGSKLRSASRVRCAATLPGAIGEIEPLLSTLVLGPTDITNGVGGGPSHGASTRVSWPISRSARARPST